MKGFGIGFYKIRLPDWILNPDFNPIWPPGFGLDFKSKIFGLTKALIFTLFCVGFISLAFDNLA